MPARRVEADLASAANVTAAAGEVTVVARSANLADAIFESRSGATINIQVPSAPAGTAAGTTRAKLRGNVRTGTGPGATAGALSVSVLAESLDLATAKMDLEGGGAISVSDADGESLADPTTETTLGSSGSVLLVTNNVTAQALGTTDADTGTESGTGGAINIQGFSATATVTPTVKTIVGSGARIEAGGTITIAAAHNEVPAGGFDGSFVAGNVDLSNGINGNRIVFSVAHDFATGNVVRYDARGNFPVGGLESGRTYGVIVPTGDTTAVQLGAVFTGTVDLALDEIDFGAGNPHRLETGDHVFYFVQGGSAIGGLTSGGRYDVIRISDTRLRLVDPANARTPVSVNAGAVDNAGDRINASHTFQNGDAVTYTAPAAVATFASTAVNVKVVAGDPTRLAITDPDGDGEGPVIDEENEAIFVARPDGDGNFTPHGITTGTALHYSVTGGLAIGGLMHNTVYFAIALNDGQIRLATEFCFAVGTCIDDKGTPDPSDDEVIPQQFINLTPNKTTAGAAAVHTFRNPNNLPIQGLTDGDFYLVTGVVPGTSFQLASKFGGGPIGLENGGLTGGPHLFKVEHRNLTSGGSGAPKFVVDLTLASSGTHRLVGTGASVSGTTSGNREVEASSTGDGGAAIDVRNGNATAESKPDVDVVVGGSSGSETRLTAASITVRTNAIGSARSSSSTAGGGAISLGDADSTATTRVRSTVEIGANARLTATGAITVVSRSDVRANAVAEAEADAAITDADARSVANLDYDTDTIVAGTLTAGGAVVIDARTVVDGVVHADASSDSAFGAANANESDPNGVRVGKDTGANTRVTLEPSARITGDTAAVQALVESVSGVATAHTDADAGGADSDAEGNVDVRGLTEVLLRSGSEVFGNQSVFLRAAYENVSVLGKPRATCSCGAADTDARANVNIDSTAQVTGQVNAIVKTAELDVEANQVITLYDRAPSRNGAFVDIGGNSRNGDAQARRQIFWAAYVIMLGEPNPEVEIDATGKITKLVNAEVRDDLGIVYGLGATIPVGREIVVQDLIYDEPANARFSANALPVDLDCFNVLGLEICAHTPDGEIWGNAGTFEFQDTWDFVHITNRSDRRLRTNVIDVVNTHTEPVILISVDKVHENGDDPFPTDLSRGYARGDLRLRHRAHVPADAGRDPEPAAVRRHARARHRPRRLDREPDRADVRGERQRQHPRRLRRGRRADPDERARAGRRPRDDRRADTRRGGRSTVELVQWRDTDDLVHPIIVTAEAGQDLVLDLTANRRSEATLGAPFSVPIASLRAGDDVDVVLNDSKEGNDTDDIGFVDVTVLDPTTTTVTSPSKWSRIRPASSRSTTSPIRKRGIPLST